MSFGPLVAPPRGRGSKPKSSRSLIAFRTRRPPTGAWIETGGPSGRSANAPPSPPHGGVDRNVESRIDLFDSPKSPPHGGVDRNSADALLMVNRALVAPPRGRGSKHVARAAIAKARGRPPTGAWIETRRPVARPTGAEPSPPHGGVDRNDLWLVAISQNSDVAPPRGRGSKQIRRPAAPATLPSPPHGGVDRNHADHANLAASGGRPPTGAWIETALKRKNQAGAARRPPTGAWIETTTT